MPPLRSLGLVMATAMLTSCATTPADNDPLKDLGILWVKHAAEYRAIATQVYGDAEDDLPALLQDRTWNAISGFGARSDLPPAIILYVDETVVSNVDFQLTFERPFANHKLDTWSSNYDSLAVPGVQSLVQKARAEGVAVFFVTNRPCQPKDGTSDPCMQKQTTIDDIRELSIDVDADHVMLSGERPDWNKEKLSRRQHVAKTHRVIMLFGDDLSDFIPCVRDEPAGDCAEAATRVRRDELLDAHRNFWGRGWYMLPNPMHGSWTSAR